MVSVNPQAVTYFIGQTILVDASAASSFGATTVTMSGDASCTNNYSLCGIYVTLSKSAYTFNITASTWGFTSSTSLNIQAVPKPTTAINPSAATLYLGGTQSFSIQITPPPSDYSSVTWVEVPTNSAQPCGQVSGSGQTATYTANSTADLGGPASCSDTVQASYMGITTSANITVKNPTISVPTSVTIPLGATPTQTVTATAINGVIPNDFTFSMQTGACTLGAISITNNPAVPSGTASIAVTGPSLGGTCLVLAASPTLEYAQSIPIQVTNDPVKSLAISPGNASVLPNNSYMFSIQGFDQNGNVVTSMPADFGVAVTGNGNCRPGKSELKPVQPQLLCDRTGPGTFRWDQHQPSNVSGHSQRLSRNPEHKRGDHDHQPDPHY